MPSFTQRTADLGLSGPVIEVAFTPSATYMLALGLSPATAPSIRVNALIDTGASGTAIGKGLADSLGISPVGMTHINTPTSSLVPCHQFDVQLVLPNNVNIPSIIVTETPLMGQPIQCLIGRDVLQQGVFIYTGHDNSFTLSF